MLFLCFFVVWCTTNTTQDSPTTSWSVLSWQVEEISSAKYDEFYNESTRFLNLAEQDLTSVPDLCDENNFSYAKDVVFIDLARNNIKKASFEWLCLVGLQWMDFSANQIESITNLIVPMWIKKLSLFENKLTTLEWIERYTQLEYLDVSYNTLNTIANIEELQLLTSLELQHNQLKSIDAVAKLPLDKLKIEFNEITDVSVLQDITTLKEVTLGYNPLPEDVIQTYVDLTKQNNRQLSWGTSIDVTWEWDTE